MRSRVCCDRSRCHGWPFARLQLRERRSQLVSQLRSHLVVDKEVNSALASQEAALIDGLLGFRIRGL